MNNKERRSVTASDKKPLSKRPHPRRAPHYIKKTKQTVGTGAIDTGVKLLRHKGRSRAESRLSFDKRFSFQSQRLRQRHCLGSSVNRVGITKSRPRLHSSSKSQSECSQLANTKNTKNYLFCFFINLFFMINLYWVIFSVVSPCTNGQKQTFYVASTLL